MENAYRNATRAMLRWRNVCNWESLSALSRNSKIQHWVNVSGDGIILQFNNRVRGMDVYSLNGATPGSTWSDLNIEQQGDVVANIWLLQHGRAPTNGSLSSGDYQNIFNSSRF